MPQMIRCTKCKTTLYEGFELESPLEVMAGKNGTCPNCGRILEFSPDVIKITPMNPFEALGEK